MLHNLTHSCLIFFSRVSLCWLLFRYPFHPRVTVAARKRSRPFCQKCKWQDAAKKACTLRMWLSSSDIVHGCMVYTERARNGSSFMWHQPCQRNVAVHHFGGYSKTRYKKAIHTCRIICERSESAWERRIALNKSDQQILAKCCLWVWHAFSWDNWRIFN